MPPNPPHLSFISDSLCLPRFITLCFYLPSELPCPLYSLLFFLSVSPPPSSPFIFTHRSLVHKASSVPSSSPDHPLLSPFPVCPSMPHFIFFPPIPHRRGSPPGNLSIPRLPSAVLKLSSASFSFSFSTLVFFFSLFRVLISLIRHYSIPVSSFFLDFLHFFLHFFSNVFFSLLTQLCTIYPNLSYHLT